MADKDKRPADSNPDQPTPGSTPTTDSSDSVLDFGIAPSVREGASGIIPLADLPDPQSSPSLVSWTEVIRQHRETAQPPSADAPIQPVTIDSTSDKDLLARIAHEEQHGASILATEPAKRDTDKLGALPLVRGKPGSSIQLDRDVDEGSQQPRSGSSVRFDVKEPPSDAGGAMPSPWADAMIMDAIPVSDAEIGDADVPFAEAIPYEPGEDELAFAAEMAGAGASGSAVNFEGGSKDDDIMETPLDNEGSPAGRSSILDMLVQDDRLEEAGPGRAPSDVVDVTAGPVRGVLSGIDSGRGRTEPLYAEEAAIADADILDAPMADVEAWSDAGAPTTTPAMDRESANPEEAVDLYAEGPVGRGISDSGSLQVTDEEMKEASRRHRAVESSAIDLSSNPSGSMFDVELSGKNDEAEIDMGLTEDNDPAAQSSMIRRGAAAPDEERLTARMDRKKKAARIQPPQEDDELPPRGRKPRAAEPNLPARMPASQFENEGPADTSESPQPTSRAPRTAKAEPPRKKRGGILIGMFLGILLAAGGAGAAWYFKQLPDRDTVFGDGAIKGKDSSGNDGDVAKAKKDTEDAKKALDGLREQLTASGIRVEKAEEGLKTALAGKVRAEGQVKSARDALGKAGIMDADLASGVTKLVDANEDAKKEMAAVTDKIKPKKDQKIGDAVQAIIAEKEKAVTNEKQAQISQKQAELTVEKAVTQLKDAGFDDPKLEEGIKKAIAGKTDAETKIKTALLAIEKAGVKDPDLAKALAMLISAKDGSDAAVKGVRERLEKAKIVPANADQAALFKAIDEAITRGSADAVVKLAAEKKAAEERTAKLDDDLKTTRKDNAAIALKAADDLNKQKATYEAKLADVRTPAQVVDVWLPALAEKEKGANAAAAIADADVVLKNAASTDADKAKALAVKALALRNQGKVTEARAAFAAARNHPGFAKDQTWAKEIAKAADTLDNPAAFVGVTATPPATQQQLLDRVDSGLKLFEGEKYAKDRARLVAQRSLLKLEANDLPGALADAAEAVKNGAGADGQFALARALEAQGKTAEAEGAYRDILRTQAEGTSLHKQASLGLARVLLQKNKPAALPMPTSMRDRNDLHARVALTLVLLADPESTIPPDIQEALRLADSLIALKEFHGYIIKADALAKLGRFNDALAAYSTGIKTLKVLPKEYDGVLDRILARHPALQRPDPNPAPDHSRSEKHYAQGLEYYRGKQYSRAEEQFMAAIRNWNQDARYLYYLGLARWSNGNRTVAAEDFKAGALLEMKGLPLPNVITEAFERIQGDRRAAVEAFRP